jgi:hypothetical protein
MPLAHPPFDSDFLFFQLAVRLREAGWWLLVEECPSDFCTEFDAREVKIFFKPD